MKIWLHPMKIPIKSPQESHENHHKVHENPMIFQIFPSFRIHRLGLPRCRADTFTLCDQTVGKPTKNPAAKREVDWKPWKCGSFCDMKKPSWIPSYYNLDGFIWVYIGLYGFLWDLHFSFGYCGFNGIYIYRGNLKWSRPWYGSFFSNN